MKWYKYLFFYCLVFFCFSCNVFGIRIKDEPYDKDCAGNIVPQIKHQIGSFNSDINPKTCSINAIGTETPSNEKVDLYSCTPEPTSEEKARKILLLIDNSYSMYNENNNWKVEEVRKIFRQIANQMENEDMLYIKYFKNVWSGNTKTNWNKIYKKTDVNSKSERKTESNKILKYTKEGETCTTSLCYGTPTYSVSALEKAKDFVKGNDFGKSVPIVIFITDGYPTSFKGSGSEGKIYNLGYLSSARHFYKFAVAMKELKETFVALKTKTNGNTYIANGQFSPKFVTIGLGVDNNNNNAAKYLLNTDPDTLKDLRKNAASSIPKIRQQYKEDTKFYNMLQTKNGDDKYEITASIASNPDLGVAGTSPDDRDKQITFSANALSIIKKQGTEVAFGPIRTANIKEVIYYKKVGDKCKQMTVNPDDKNWVKNLSEGYEGFSVITIPRDACLLKNKVVINLKNKVSESLKTYSSTNYKIGSYLDGFVSKYYGKTSGNKVTVDEVTAILNYGTAVKKEKLKTINVKKTTYDYINSDYKYLELGNGYVRHCSPLVNDEQDCPSTYVKLRVKYFIVYNVQFDGGSLKNNDSAIAPGTGFKFQNLKTTITGKWLYTGYADLNYQSPIIQYQVSDSNKWYDINYDSVYSDSGLTSNKFISKDDLWNEIDAKVQIEDINIQSEYTTVDSNDANNSAKDVSDKIDSNKDTSVTNPTVTDSNKYYVTTKTDSIKKSCIKAPNFVYVDENKNCPAEYAQTDSYAGEDFSYIEKNGRYYFIPFGYKQKTVDVKVELNVAGNKALSTTCKINVHNNVSPCSDDNTSTIEEQVSYRSIDKDNPFPRADNKYYSIPLNWRSWYCDGSISKVTCAVKGQNQRRLINSYSGGPYYSKQYKSQDLTQIANDTRDNSKNYYSSWANIDQSGNSSSIGSDSTDIIYKKFGSNINSYCHLGSFKSECDGVMNK